MRAIGEATEMGAERCRRELAPPVSRHGIDRRVADALAVRRAARGNVAAGVSLATRAVAPGVSQTSRNNRGGAEFRVRALRAKNCGQRNSRARSECVARAMNGAEPVNPETMQRFTERFARYGFRNETHLPVYGLAESSLAVTVPPLNRGPKIDRVDRETFTTRDAPFPRPPMQATAISFVSSGVPLARARNSTRRWQGTEVPERTEGFLWFRGPSATSGYYHNAAATEKLLPLGPAKSRAR